jgi:recombination protein RecA
MRIIKRFADFIGESENNRLKDQKKVITVTCRDTENSLEELLKYIQQNGNGGHSFSIVVDPDGDKDQKKTFGWDGDGSDRIFDISSEMVDEEEEEKVEESEKGVDLRDAMDAIRAKFGEDSIMKLGEKQKVNINAIPTGSLGLDWALGIGGVPRGRIIEIFGPESSGKTTLALHIVAEAQKLGGVCAYIDAEHAMDPEYATRLGVKIDDLLISQPDTGEQALDIVDSLIRTNKMDVVVIDSVAALTPKAEIEGDMGAFHVGTQARLMSQALRKLTAIVARSKSIVIFINQIRMQIGVMFGNPETTPGGKALKFYSSVRLDIRRIAQIKKGEEIMGGRVRVKVVKNKVAAPFKQTEFDLMYNEGISQEGEIIALGEKYEIIQKSGSSYSFGETKMGRGYDATRQFLKENPPVRAEILKQIREKLNSQ